MQLPDADVIHDIAFCYPMESDVRLFNDRPEWTTTGIMGIDDVYGVVEWKANRIKNRFMNDPANKAENIEALTAEALRPFASLESLALDGADSESVVNALRRLTTLNFVATRVASAILTVYRPTLFTVLDWRAWATLVRYEVDGIEKNANLNLSDTYIRYLRACHRIAGEKTVSLRNLDRFLYVMGGTGGTHEEYLEARKSALKPDGGW